MKSALTIISLLFFTGIVMAAREPSLDNSHKTSNSFHAEYNLKRVIDGDTIIADEIKIRLWGIDAPEKKSDYYFASKLLLESLLQDGKLKCKFIEKDRYKRHVMHCLIDGVDVGSMMVHMGMAKDYSKYSGDYYQLEQDLARAEGRGIWKKKSK